MCSGDLQDVIILAACGFHDHNYSGDIGLDMKLLGTTVNIH